MMRLRAPAKINLHLRVGPKRADGFHSVVSWMSTVGLFDTLTIDRAHGRQFALSCDDPAVPCDASNLVVKAAAALADSVAKGSSVGLIASLGSPTHLQKNQMGGEARELDREPGVREGGATTDFGQISSGEQIGSGEQMRLSEQMHLSGLSVALQKRIPVGAGLGGGSSDGAFTLYALNHLWRLNWPRQRLAEIAKSLGSDVPFFLSAPSAICRGRGEEVEKAGRAAIQWVLLVLWPRPMPTPQVYRKFDEMGLGSESNLHPEPPWNDWVKLASLDLLPLLVNDLEPAAFAIDPQLGAVRAELEQLLERPVRMSGSGSSLFSLYDHEAQAKEAAQLTMQRHKLEALTVELAPQQSEIAQR